MFPYLAAFLPYDLKERSMSSKHVGHVGPYYSSRLVENVDSFSATAHRMLRSC